jgi:hypothetical protein
MEGIIVVYGSDFSTMSPDRDVASIWDFCSKDMRGSMRSKGYVLLSEK